jgi:hypothetical protein
MKNKFVTNFLKKLKAHIAKSFYKIINIIFKFISPSEKRLKFGRNRRERKFRAKLKIKETNLEIRYLNKIRAKHHSHPLRFDKRAYRLDIARLRDMSRYHYFDHVNPRTGAYVENMKKKYGFRLDEYLAENLFGDGQSSNFRAAVSSWMNSRGHRYNLLYPHYGGAIACYKGNVIFLGVNQDHFRENANTGRQGLKFWKRVPRQRFEK